MTAVNGQGTDPYNNLPLAEIKWAGAAFAGLYGINKVVELVQATTSAATNGAFWLGRAAAQLPTPTVLPPQALTHADYRIHAGAAILFGVGATYGYLKHRHLQRAKAPENIQQAVVRVLQEQKGSNPAELTSQTIEKKTEETVTKPAKKTRVKDPSKAGKSSSSRTKTSKVAQESIGGVATRTRSRRRNS